MSWLQIAIWVASLVISYKMRPKPETPPAASLQDIEAPTADPTRPIPKLYGTKWIKGPNVLWYGDLKADPITQNGPRRYGLFGPKEKITVGYRYSLGLHLGLCLGPVQTILGIKADDLDAWEGFAGDGDRIRIDKPELFGGDQRDGGMRGAVDVLMGAPDQAVNDYLADQLPAPLPAFRGIASLVFRRVYFGNTPYIKNLAVLASTVVDKEFVGGADWDAILRTDLDFEIANTSPRLIVTDGLGNWVTYKSGVISGVNYLSLYRSTDNGRTWTRTTPLFRLGQVSNETAVGLAVGYLANGVVRFLLLGRNLSTTNNQSSSIKFSDDGGATWNDAEIDAAFGWSVGNCYMCWSGARFVAIRGRVPTGADTGKFCITSADGISWAKTAQTLPENFGNTLSIDSDGFGTVIAARAGSGTTPVAIMKSSNHGINWEPPQVFSEIVQGIITTNDVLRIRCGEYRGPQTTWVAVFGAGSTTREWNGLISRDNGDTWNYFALPMADALRQRIRNIITDRRGNWIAFGGDLAFISYDDAETWEELPVRDSLNARLTGVSSLTFTDGASDGRGNWLFTGNVPAGSTARTYGVIFNTDGPKPDLLQGDMNPADIIREALTDPVAGLGYSDDQITTGDAFGSFDRARELFNAEGFGLSFLQSFQESAEDFVRAVQEHADAAVQVDPETGKWIIVPIRDDYDPDALPVAGTSDVIEVESFRRPGYGDLINQVTVIYDDRATAKQESVTVQNQAVRAVQGATSAQTNNYPGIGRADLAMRVASRDLRQLSTPLARATLTLRPEFGRALRAGSVFRWEWPPLGISGMVLRVIEINYGDLLNGAVRVQVVEDVFATARALYDPPTSGWINPVQDPRPVETRRVEEAPYGLLVSDIIGDTPELPEAVESGLGVAIVQAQSPGGGATGYAIASREGGAGAFEDEGTAPFTASATLPASLPQAVSSVVTFPESVDLSLVQTGQLASINGEWCAVAAVAGQAVTFHRGVLDTPPRKHLAGVPVWFTALGYGVAETLRAELAERAYRLLTENARGRLPVEDLDGDEAADIEADEDVLTFEARAFRPYPPGNLLIGGERYPSNLELSDPVSITWAHRDRLAQGAELVPQTEGDIGPEDGTTYRVQVTGLSGTVHVNATGISDNSYNLTGAALAEPAITVEIWAERDGAESLHAQSVFIMGPVGLGFALGQNLGGRGLVYEVAAALTPTNPTSSYPDSRRVAPVIGADGLLYAGPAVIDPQTLETVKFWPTPSPFYSPGFDPAEATVFALYAYAPEIGRGVGVRSNFVRRIIGGTTIETVEHVIETVDPADDWAPGSTGYTLPSSGAVLRYLPEWGRVLALGIHIEVIDPETWTRTGWLQSAPGVPSIVGVPIWEAFYHAPTATMYALYPQAGRVYYWGGVDETTSTQADALDYIAAPVCRSIAYVPTIDRLVIGGEFGGSGRLYFIDPATNNEDTGMAIDLPGGALGSPRGLFYNAETDRLYVGTAGGSVIVIDIGAHAIEFNVGVTAPGLPNPSGAPFPRQFVQDDAGAVFYLNGRYIHQLT